MGYYRKRNEPLPRISRLQNVDLDFHEVKPGRWEADMGGYAFVFRGDRDTGYEAFVLSTDGKVVVHSRERRRTRGAMGARGKFLSEDSGAAYKSIKTAKNWLNKQAEEYIGQSIRWRNERLQEQWRERNPGIKPIDADVYEMDFETFWHSEYNHRRGEVASRPRTSYGRM